jgi:hypothetical protein
MRKEMFRLAMLILLVTTSIDLYAQTSGSKSVGYVYDTEKAYELRFHTNKGIGLAYQKGKIRTYYKTSFYRFGISELKHQKEFKQGADPAVTRAARPFTYGKQNNLFALRLSYGNKRYFSEKAKRKGVAVGMSYSLGGTLGILKPYYLIISRPVPDQPNRSYLSSERYTEDNATLFLDDARILGASSFFKGFGQASFRPGANASISTHLDWGAFDSFMRAMELGMMVDFFPTTMPILVSEDNQKLFINFYLSFQMGKRK